MLLCVSSKEEPEIPKLNSYNEGRGPWSTTGNVGIAAKMDAFLPFVFASWMPFSNEKS